MRKQYKRKYVCEQPKKFKETEEKPLKEDKKIREKTLLT